MPAYSGNATAINFTPVTPTASALINIGGDSRNFSYNISVDRVDAGYRSNPVDKLPGVPTIEWSLDGVDTAGSLVDVPALKPPTTAGAPATTGTLDWYPEGNTTGKRKKSATAMIENYEWASPYDDVPTFTLSGSITSAITHSTVV